MITRYDLTQSITDDCDGSCSMVENKNKAVIAGVTRTFKSLVDGTLRLQIDIEPNDAVLAVQLFGQNGTPVAVAVLSNNQQKDDEPSGGYFLHWDHPIHPNNKPPMDSWQKELFKSSFFRSPATWQAVGTDAQFLEWLKGQECCAKSVQPCSGDIVSAHVRRIANGAGTGIKPQYSAVPMCDTHHQLQHHQGESAVGGKEHLDQQRIKHIHAWCWWKVKTDLSFNSWSDMPQEVFTKWCNDNGLGRS